MLRDLLTRDTLEGAERARAERALGSPWCWPADPALRKRAEGHGFRPPPGPAPGESLLVSVAPGEGRTTLWTLLPDGRPRPNDDPEVAAFVRGAAGTIRLAEQIAARELPLLPLLPFRRRLRPADADHRWFARWLVSRGPGRESVLRGESFGLAMLLGVASLWLGEALPPDLCALATLSVPGAPEREVTRLRQKLELLHGTGLAVRRLLVAADQERKVRAILDTLRPTPAFDLVPVRHPKDALRAAFPSSEALVTAQWERVEDARTAAREVFRVARDGSPFVLGWAGVCAAAEALAARLAREPDASIACWQADFAVRVARRHLGEDAPLDWPPAALLASLRRPLQLRVLAHVVQSVADSLTGDPSLVLRAVEAVARPGDECDGDVRLLGAAARALASRREYVEAAKVLERALDGWHGLEQVKDASYALSESLRILGVLGDADRLDRVLAAWLPRMEDEPELEPESLGYVRLAGARALVQSGRPERALELLAPDDGRVDWHAILPLRRGQLRWRARANAALGRTGAAEDDRRALEALFAGRQPPPSALCLARLDAALESGADDATLERLLAEALTSEQAHEVRRVDAPELDLRARIRRIVEEYRY